MRRILYILFLFSAVCCAPVQQTEVPPTLPPAPLYCVVLDYGHGGFDPGAVGSATHILESDLNLLLGERIAKELEAQGCLVLRTRTDADALGETKQDDMHRRGVLLNSEAADCTVSIHMNFFSDPSVRGPMCYYQTDASDGERLAAAVLNALTEALSLPERSPNPGDNYVTRVPKAPSVLVECGFLSNSEDERLLQDPEYQNLLARAVADGILRFLCENPTS